MHFETVKAPFTRWKQGKRGVLPKTAPMTRPVKLEQVSAPFIPTPSLEDEFNEAKLPGFSSITETVNTAIFPEMPIRMKGEKKVAFFNRMSDWTWACYHIEANAKQTNKLVVKRYVVLPALESEQNVPRGTTQGIERTLPQSESQPFIGPINQQVRDKSNWIPQYGVRPVTK